MSAEALKWVFWIIGTVGIAGAIALLVLAPTVFTVVFNAAAKVVGVLLKTRIGCAALAAVAAFLLADYHRASLDQADWERQIAAFEQAQKNRDARIAQETRDEVWKEIANAAAENTAIDTQVKEFHDALPPISPAVVNPFLVGDASCRLRNIAGFAGCGPVRAHGMPKAGPKGAGTGRKHWSGIRLPGLITRGFSGAAPSK